MYVFGALMSSKYAGPSACAGTLETLLSLENVAELHNFANCGQESQHALFRCLRQVATNDEQSPFRKGRSEGNPQWELTSISEVYKLFAVQSVMCPRSITS